MKPPRTRTIVLLVLLLAGCSRNNVSINQNRSGDKPNQQTSVVTPVVNNPNHGCDPNYSECVPIASDVDCAGGSGNGPAYVRGPIKVIGKDIYRLDSDGDGIACE